MALVKEPVHAAGFLAKSECRLLLLQKPTFSSPRQPRICDPQAAPDFGSGRGGAFVDVLGNAAGMAVAGVKYDGDWVHVGRPGG